MSKITPIIVPHIIVLVLLQHNIKDYEEIFYNVIHAHA
jgi:hypothetical protein